MYTCVMDRQVYTEGLAGDVCGSGRSCRGIWDERKRAWRYGGRTGALDGGKELRARLRQQEATGRIGLAALFGMSLTDLM